MTLYILLMGPPYDAAEVIGAYLTKEEAEGYSEISGKNGFWYNIIEVPVGAEPLDLLEAKEK